jgi:hypothetical protein
MWGQMRSDAVSLTAHSALTSAYINNQVRCSNVCAVRDEEAACSAGSSRGICRAAPLLDAAGAPAAREVPQLSPAHPSRRTVLCGASDLVSR